MKHVALHHVEVEEQQDKQQCEYRAESDNLHRDVALRTFYGSFRFFATHFFCRKADCSFDYSPRAYYTYDTRHGYTAYANTLGVLAEYHFGRHVLNCYGYVRIPCVENLVAEYKCKPWNYYEPDNERAGTYYGCIFQTDYISQSQYGSTCIDFEYQLEFFCYHFSGTAYTACEILVPPSECTYYEIVQTSYKSSHEKRFSLVAAFLARNKDLCAGCSFRERIFAMLVLYEIFTEWNKEQDAKYTSKE